MNPTVNLVDISVLICLTLLLWIKLLATFAKIMSKKVEEIKVLAAQTDGLSLIPIYIIPHSAHMYKINKCKNTNWGSKTLCWVANFRLYLIDREISVIWGAFGPELRRTGNQESMSLTFLIDF